jgi:hypothetical protein
MLTAHGAFVVQVDDSADPAGGRLDGRVEHVVSGKSAAFDSAGALLAFITEALGGARAAAKPAEIGAGKARPVPRSSRGSTRGKS